MAKGVAQALLDDAVRLPGDELGHRGRIALQGVRHLQAGAGQQALQGGEVRGREIAVVLAQQAEDGVEFADRAPGGLLDGGERLAYELGVRVQDAAGRARLERHRAQGVAHRVVQLARQPVAYGELRRALLGGGQLVGRRRAEQHRREPGEQRPGRRRTGREAQQHRDPGDRGARHAPAGGERSAGAVHGVAQAGEGGQRDQEHRERGQRQAHPAQDPAERDMQRVPGGGAKAGVAGAGGTVGERRRIDPAQRPRTEHEQRPGDRHQAGDGGERQRDGEGDERTRERVEGADPGRGRADDDRAHQEVRHQQGPADDQMDPAVPGPYAEQSPHHGVRPGWRRSAKNRAPRVTTSVPTIICTA